MEDTDDFDDRWETDDGANPLSRVALHRRYIFKPGSNFYGIDKFRKNDGTAGTVDVADDTVALPGDECGMDINYTKTSPCNEESTEQFSFDQNEEGDNYLHCLIIHKRKDDVKKILGLNVFDLDLQNGYGQTALHLATITKQSDVVQALLLAGASHTIQDRNGRTPLHIACEMGSLTMVKTLTSLDGIFLPYPRIEEDYQGNPYVYTAAKRGHTDIVKYLVDMCGHNINGKELRAGKSVLHLAIEKCQLRLLDFLLNHKETDLTIEDYSGHRALGLARYHPESLNFIIQNKPDLEYVLTDMFFEDLIPDDDEFLPEE